MNPDALCYISIAAGHILRPGETLLKLALILEILWLYLLEEDVELKKQIASPTWKALADAVENIDKLKAQERRKHCVDV